MYEFMLALSVVVLLGVCVWYARHPAASIFHPLTFYLMFHALVFVVRPIFAWVYDFHALYDAIQFQPTMAQKITVLICTNLGLVVFSAVTLAVANEPIRFKQSLAQNQERDILLKPFLIAAIPIAALGMWALSSALQFKVNGNMDDIRVIDQRTGAGHLVGVSGYFISLPLMLGPLVAIIAFLGRFRLPAMLPFLAFALLKLGTGGRGPVVAAAVMIMLFYLYDRRRNWPGLPILATALFSWSIFSAIGADRGAGIREAIGMQEESTVRLRTQAEGKPLENMDLANMEFFEFLVWAIPQRTGTYDYFIHQLQIFTEPIPRALWPGKPVGPPIPMFNLYRYGVPLGATTSVPGAGWHGLGYVGVVIWSAFFAMLYAVPYRMFARSNAGTLATAAYMILVATSIVAYRDGGPMTILKALQFYFIPVIALWLTQKYLDYYRGGASVAPGGGARFAGESGLTAKQRRQAAMRNSDGMVGAVDAAPSAPSPLSGTPRDRRLARIKASF